MYFWATMLANIADGDRPYSFVISNVVAQDISDDRIVVRPPQKVTMTTH